jgi:peptidoglycan hydrolase-like protein with peptidoglycan-binding domain
MIILTGCSTPMDARRDAQFQSYGHIADRPTVRPVRAMSSFADSLQCMDQLMREAQVPTTLITSKQIPDFSTRAPVATKEMIVTALLQMSRVSNVFRYVDYEVDLVRQDTVQNLTNILLNNNQIQLQRPALYFSGAISYVDQNVLSNRGNLGTSANRFESGYSRNKNATVVSLELHLGDFRTRTLIPGMDSSNEVIIGNGGEGLDLAGRIGEYGWQFNVGKDYAQGSGAAVRTLVDLAVIELAGKWARVPYWQCLTMEQTHPNFQRQLRDWYDEGADGVHQGLIIQSLQSKGYLSSGASASALMLRRAISRFQADHGMVINGVVDFPTYERALRDFVALDSNGNLVRYGWRTSNAEPVAVVRDPDLAPPFKLKAYGEPAEKLQINIQIENVMNGRTQFEVGEQVFASVQVSRNSFLKCFLSNASGSVIQIFPNPLSRPHAQANQAIRLPDWMTPNPGYVIETTAAGTEGILCLATDEEVADKLPSLLKVPAFVKIVEVEGLADILQAYESALGSDQYASQILSWKVAPKASVTDLNSRNP